VAYSEVSDMLTGNIPVGGTMPQKYVNDAADEIDSVIGGIYVTPINMDPTPSDTPPGTGTVQRSSRLLLKRISNFLASGRYMLATAAGGEDDQLHAYAKYLVDTALAALMRIATGEVVLEGATKSDPEGEEGLPGPLISNVDPESNVEAFYDRIYASPFAGFSVYWRPAGG
jgi:hypothetical protein